MHELVRHRYLLEGEDAAQTGVNPAVHDQLVVDGKVDPCLSRVFAFEEIGVAHQLMHENKHPEGNMVALVSAPREGLTELPGG